MARTRATPTATAVTVESASRTITDDLNRKVEIRGTPQRIAALSPTLVEVLFAIGITPVGRPSSANYPAAAKQLVDIGTSNSPNYEQIAEIKPDLLVGSSAMPGAQIAKLESLGMPLILLNTAGFTDVVRCVKLLGQITAKEAEAQRAAKSIEDKVAAIKAKIPAEKPTVIILVGSGQTFYAALSTSYVGKLVKELGAANVATEVEDNRHRGFTPYSADRLAEKDPEVLIVIKPTVDPQRLPSVLSALQKDQKWESLAAVKTKRVHEVSPLLLLYNPGLRVDKALTELASILYPETYGGRTP